MIDLFVEFDTADVGSIVELFCTLPDELCPTHFSFGEGESDALISSVNEVLESVGKAGIGPVLKNAQVTYEIGFFDGLVGEDRVTSKTITCSGFLKLGVEQVKKLMKEILKSHPIFGFACLPEEREAKNRVVIQQGVNKVESWVGRDVNKYIPGFYWLTMLTNELLLKHGLQVEAIRAQALEAWEVNGNYLFCFYEDPGDWNKSVATQQLYSFPGVFNIEKAKKELSSKANFLELDAALRQWK
jgi:hypothetical protein